MSKPIILAPQPDDFDTYDDIALLYLDGREHLIGDAPFVPASGIAEPWTGYTRAGNCANYDPAAYAPDARVVAWFDGEPAKSATADGAPAHPPPPPRNGLLMTERAMESDTAVRDADLRGVLTFLMIRHAAFVSAGADNPMRSTYEAARDSAVREVEWRFAQVDTRRYTPAPSTRASAGRTPVDGSASFTIKRLIDFVAQLATRSMFGKPYCGVCLGAVDGGEHEQWCGVPQVLAEGAAAVRSMSEIEEAHGAEVAALNAWVHDLQSGMYINCVYCGHCYGPEGDPETTMQDALTAHIAACPKHPLTKALADLDGIRRAVAETIDADPETWPDHGNAPLAITAGFALRDMRLRNLTEALGRLVAETEAEYAQAIAYVPGPSEPPSQLTPYGATLATGRKQMAERIAELLAVHSPGNVA